MAKQKRHAPDEINRKLHQAEVELAAGKTIARTCKKLGISEQTFHRWRKRYGGMKPEQAKRLEALEVENARLRKLVVDLALENQVFKEKMEDI